MKTPLLFPITASLLVVTGCGGGSSPPATQSAQSASAPQEPATATQDAAAAGFSFDVYGDSRSMMYLPYRASQQADARKLMVDMFDLVLPEKVAAGVVEKYVKLTYDPSTHELIQAVMPFETRSEVNTLTFDKGWVTSASVEDVKLLPGVHRTMFRLEGGEWVAREVVRDIKTGNARFLLNTGDLVWWGRQGDKPSDNPYWTLVDKEVLQQLPPPDDEMRKAGMEGRVFPAVGNHEVWADSDVEGLLASFPYLRNLGVSDKQLIYKFDFRGARFIFLWTGPYDYRQPSEWNATQPAYEAQMVQLKSGWTKPSPAGSRRSSLVSTPRCTAAPAWVRFPRYKIHMQRSRRMPKTWISWSSMAMCTPLSCSKRMASSTLS